jgi:hypothetical protein
MTERPGEDGSDAEPPRDDAPETEAVETPADGNGDDGDDPARPDAPSTTDDDGGPLAGRRDTVAKGLLVTAVVAVAVAGAAAVAPTLGVDSAPATEFETFDPDRTVTEPLPSTGAIEPEPPIVPAGGTVVVDVSRVDRSRLGPLSEALSRANHDVEYAPESLSDSLDGADGLVIVDPEVGYSTDELDAVEAFADEGGRVVIFGNPNRFEASTGPLDSSLAERESELGRLGGRFDLYFDTRYVYDQERNDGNYRHVVASPPEGASLTDGNGSIPDAEDIVLYTPTEVRSTDDGEPILVTGPNARTADSDTQREHTLAMRDGNVLAIGDARFIAADRYNVGDNEEFLAGVVEFLVSGDRDDSTGAGGANGSDVGGNAGGAENGSDTGAENGSDTGGNETAVDARVAA